MKKWLTNIGSKMGIAVMVLLILFFSLKGCVVGIWMAPREATTYAIHGEDGRSLVMVFLPQHETILLYTEEDTGFVEAVLTQMRGTYGTHYFWRLWKVEGPGANSGLKSVFLGYRLYPDNTDPVVMEMKVLKKFIHGSSRPSLPSEGETTHPVILFSSNAVGFEGMWLTKEPTDPQLVQGLLNQLKPN